MLGLRLYQLVQERPLPVGTVNIEVWFRGCSQECLTKNRIWKDGGPQIIRLKILVKGLVKVIKRQILRNMFE